MALLFEDLTDRIIGVCVDLHKELGHGFNEAIYHRALLIALSQAGFQTRSEVAFKVMFRGHEVGTYVADIIVNDCVLLELKALSALAPEHQAQVINYLKASGIKVGLLINFGTATVKVKRLEHPAVYVPKVKNAETEQ